MWQLRIIFKDRNCSEKSFGVQQDVEKWSYKIDNSFLLIIITYNKSTEYIMSFYGGIVSYDIHTYWNAGDEEEKKFSWELREKVQKEFAKEIEAGEIRVHKFWDKPIGPHTINMWEIDFKSPEIFARIVPFYQLNHGKLSVLIHPRSGKGDLIDHTEHALWLGHKQRLITSFLQ